MRPVFHRTSLIAWLACAYVVARPSFAPYPTALAQAPPPVSFLSFDEALPALDTLQQYLPAELKSVDRSALRKIWPEWLRKSDAAIRARVQRGDEDSLVNLLLYGTSFTNQPRMTARQIEQILDGASTPESGGAKLDQMTLARLDDFIAGVVSPGANERLVYARGTLESSGNNLNTAAGRQRARSEMLAAVARVLKEFAGYSRSTDRDTLFQSRGLSSDTSLFANFAVEQALREMRDSGRFAAPLNQVAVIGPGLDFADKQEGYDFYPQQTIQPFAIVDSLLRLGLASSNGVQVTTIDLSPKVNAHLDALRAKVRGGVPYVIQLPLEATDEWTPGLLRYWTEFGDRIGEAEKPASAPRNAGKVNSKAVSVRVSVAAGITSVDADVVAQHLELPPAAKFDLIIATNVFLYYNEFHQGLARVNLEKMLRPGGALVSNNRLVELASSKIRPAGATTSRYSTGPMDEDTIVWYVMDP